MNTEIKILKRPTKNNAVVVNFRMTVEEARVLMSLLDTVAIKTIAQDRFGLELSPIQQAMKKSELSPGVRVAWSDSLSKHFERYKNLTH
jgi:hypothetical protein